MTTLAKYEDREETTNSNRNHQSPLKQVRDPELQLLLEQIENLHSRMALIEDENITMKSKIKELEDYKRTTEKQFGNPSRQDSQQDVEREGNSPKENNIQKYKWVTCSLCKDWYETTSINLILPEDEEERNKLNFQCKTCLLLKKVNELSLLIKNCREKQVITAITNSAGCVCTNGSTQKESAIERNNLQDNQIMDLPKVDDSKTNRHTQMKSGTETINIQDNQIIDTPLVDDAKTTTHNNRLPEKMVRTISEKDLPHGIKNNVERTTNTDGTRGTCKTGFDEETLLDLSKSYYYENSKLNSYNDGTQKQNNLETKRTYLIGDSRIRSLYNFMKGKYKNIGSRFRGGSRITWSRWEARKTEEGSTLILQTGINNILNTTQTKESILHQFKQLIRENVETKKVIITSILPVSGFSDIINALVDEINKGLKKMAEAEGAIFIDMENKFGTRNKMLTVNYFRRHITNKDLYTLMNLEQRHSYKH